MIAYTSRLGTIVHGGALALLIAFHVSGCGGSERSTPNGDGSAGSSGAPAIDAATGADVTITDDAPNSCGAMGEPCCPWDTCSEGLGCTGLGSLQHRCYPCGHAGERCCLASPSCVEGQRCGVPLLVSDPADEPRCAPAPEAGFCITSCMPLGGQYCGRIGDNCGRLLECGSCADPGFTCGGGGIHNVCGAPRDGGTCHATECETPNGAYCGVVGDGCGADIDCGACRDGTACGALGIANMCGTTGDGGVPRDAPPPRAPKPPPPPNAP